ncbi:MAG: hypothetical protein COZ06_19010 [Armatimonadetes bacterium CG_4_10_14_3_um_filter_66_18]|nr:MAG: hypothetical protein AUJ96_26900 [Armatimonadetes bacterium CG2_30_66_41]PIU92134.1 MAG: hypothetical protein COS65_19470 [Armatimonadetes bacterium CG06_land_8_20_14_3_00_66_21]PIX39663.1 MAG: hypothetical protein COZ57_27850 [Armatimonadetes bacterium CG_4_8_14_3_um_filter_66_20]PIY45821.1 MAG: hypothetical protein COZ06_19010 [Armatimonadetes bacterium CG_4_10_14_3_um_filter_66_18]PIZ41086.1 MAG: hypothetical protein COY42_20005 [Armatimonadetes bacterium CG_4_10_14_0_8_um_filter_66_
MSVSNPQLWAVQLAELRSGLRKNPEKLFLNACENDGSGGFCVCPRCRAWDADPNAGGGRDDAAQAGRRLRRGRRLQGLGAFAAARLPL